MSGKQDAEPKTGYGPAHFSPPSSKRPVSPEARLFGNVIMWFGVAFVLGTIGGIWIKLFWMGWVFAP